MFDTDYNILFAFLTSLIITYVAIPKVIFFAEKFRLADVPGERASHETSVPIFGGIAIFSGVIFSLLFWGMLDSMQFILVSFVVVFFVGVIDDLLSLSPFRKLLGQIIAILLVIYLGEIQIDSMHGVLGVQDLPDLIATLFTVFVVIVITNAFNLIDGVDGLASGIGFISSFCFGVVSLLMKQYDMAMIAFSLMGSLLAFLKYNFHPARIFMGDTGSLLIGMTLSVLAINLIDTGLVTDTIHLPNKGPLLAIVFLAIPLFDSLRVFIVRISGGRHPLHPGRGHIHHALLDLGFGHKKSTLILYVFSFFIAGFSYFMIDMALGLAIFILTVIVLSCMAVPFIMIQIKNSKSEK